MSISEELLEKLKDNGIDFFVSVPCKLTSELIVLLEKDNDIVYTPVTREEEGVGIVAGAYLTGKKPCVVMQNSGLGNSVNAICSLLNYYKIPIVFVVSHRGLSLEKVDAQKPMGEITKKLFEDMDVLVYDFKNSEEIDKIDGAIAKAYQDEKSVALLMPHEFWER